MAWEALFWTAISLLAVPVMREIWPRIETRLSGWDRPLAALAPWLHGVTPAYLALIRGAILAWDAGLKGHSALGWLGGSLMCAALVALLATRSELRSHRAIWPDPLRAGADEPRWALYRATGALLTGSHALGAAIGLSFALVEWSLVHLPWEVGQRRRPEVCAALMRIATSTLTFSLTRNLWLTLLSQGVLVALLARPRRSAPAPNASESPPDGI